MKYTVVNSIEDTDPQSIKEQFALDLLMGFSTYEKYIPSKYLYDSEGSRIFSRITEVEEYYPTNCEFEIFRTHKKKISDLFGEEKFNLIELGAGDGRKTKVLLEEFTKEGKNFEYIPIDISEAAVKDLSESLDKEIPDLKHYGVVGEYIEALHWANQNKSGKNVVFFLGSNVGNFSKAQTLGFLRTLWKTLNNGDFVLIGFDLKKDIDVLLHAYNDSHGVTRDFNLNLLSRINRELGGNFDVSKFQHYGTYQAQIGAMKSFLVSTTNQSVYIDALENEFAFKAYEPIHTEYSYKYLIDDIAFLAKETGYQIVENLSDSRNYFVDSIWKVKKVIR